MNNATSLPSCCLCFFRAFQVVVYAFFEPSKLLLMFFSSLPSCCLCFFRAFQVFVYVFFEPSKLLFMFFSSLPSCSLCFFRVFQVVVYVFFESSKLSFMFISSLPSCCLCFYLRGEKHNYKSVAKEISKPPFLGLLKSSEHQSLLCLFDSRFLQMFRAPPIFGMSRDHIRKRLKTRTEWIVFEI